MEFVDQAASCGLELKRKVLIRGFFSFSLEIGQKAGREIPTFHHYNETPQSALFYLAVNLDDSFLIFNEL